MRESSDFSLEQRGLATQVLCRSKVRHDRSFKWFSMWIEPAIAHRHIHFAFDDKGRPLAYWTWALLAEDVAERLRVDPRALLHESEWNEGDLCWIIDFVAPFGFVRDVIAFIRSSLLSVYGEAHSLRRNADGSIRSHTLWHPVNDADARSEDPAPTVLFHLPPHAFAASHTQWLEQQSKINRSADR